MEPITASAAPVQLQDRTLSTTVSLVAVCPKMDLVAVVLDANSIGIFRTSWHRLATVPVCSQSGDAIVALAWSPSGANLAVATEAAHLLIYSVDRAASAPVSRARRSARENDPVAQLSLPVAATALMWTPVLPNATASASAASSSSTATTSKYENRASALYNEPADKVGEKGLLFVGDRDANLTLFTSDLKFIMARTKVLPPQFYVDRIYLTQNLRDCVIVGYPCDLLDSSSDNSAEPVSSSCVLRSGSLSLVLDYWPELERIAREVVSLKTLMSKFEVAEDLIKESWVKGALEVVETSIVLPLKKQIVAFDEASSTWDALHDIFCGARIKGAPLQFLGTDLSENGAKEVLRLFRAHVTDIWQGVSSLLPLAENALIRSSEFRGLTRLKSRFSPVGFLFEDAEALFNAVEDLFFRLEDFISELERMSSMTEAFLAWLVLVASKAGGESIQGRTPPADSMSSRDTELVFSFFDMVTSSEKDDEECLKDNVVGQKFVGEVIPALRLFRSACDAVISRPAKTISPGLEFSPGIELPMKLSRQAGLRKCFLREAENIDGNARIYALLPTLSGRLVLILHEVSSSSWAIAQKCAHAQSIRIHDAAVLSGGEVMIAMVDEAESDGEQKTSCDLAMYNLSDSQLWEEDSFTRADNVFTAVSLPEPAPLPFDSACASSAGQVARKSELHLSVNAESGILSLLVEPRRLILLEVQQGKPNSIDMSP